MAMNTFLEQEKAVRYGIFEDIDHFVTVGNGKKENLRILDKNLREKPYSELIELRHRCAKKHQGILDEEQSATGQECKAVIQTIDRIAAVVNRADYGYASSFNRVKNIQENAVNNVLEHDRSIAQNLTQLNQTMNSAEVALKTSTWPTLSGFVDTLYDDLKSFENNWNKRKQEMNN
jgi:hypothetical protein